jgi:hypothetical protein
MANQIPLIVNAGAAQIQELATADNLEIAANVVAGGILTDGYYYANGTPVTFGTNVDFTQVASNVIPSANITYSLGNATNQWKDLWVSNATIYLNSIPLSVGNTGALQFDGNDIVTSGPNVINTGNVETTGDIVGGNLVVAAGGNLQFADGSIQTSAYGDANVAAYLPTYTGNITASIVSASGNVYAGNVILPNNGGLVQDGSATVLVGNTTIPTGTLTMYGNGNIDITASSYLQLAGGGNSILVDGTGIAVEGNVTALDTVGAYNLTGWNNISGNTISTTGNISGNSFVLNNAGNLTYSSIQRNQNPPYGSQAFGIEMLTTADDPGVFSSISAGTDYVAMKSTNAGNANVIAQGGYGVTISTSNASGGSIKEWTFTAGGATLFPGSFSTAGNVYAPTMSLTGNILTGGLISTSGNITSGNFETIGNLTSGGFYTSGDVSVAGNISVNGNIRSGSFIADYGLAVTGEVTATGNVFGAYFFGNGSQLTGLPVQYGNANVATFLADFGSNTITTTGDVSVGNVTLTDIYSPNYYANAVTYANATGHLTNTNVFTYNPTTEVLTVGNVSTTGNITGGIITANILAGEGGNVSNITGANVTGAVSLATNANVANIANVSYSVDGANVVGEVALANTVSNPSQPNITALGTITSLTANAVTIQGQLTANGNAQFNQDVYFAGNVTIPGNINQITGNSGQFFGNVVTGFGALYAGLPAGYTLLNQEITQFAASYNGYSQVSVQNINGGDQATGDFVITADNGNDFTNHIDMGVAGSGYNGALANNSLGTSLYANDGYLYTRGNVTGGNLVLGANQANGVVRIIANGASNIGNVVATFSANGLAVNGNVSAETIVVNQSIIGSGASPAPTLSGFSSISTVGTQGNISASGNLLAAGYVSAAGNVTGSYIKGNGSELTNLPAPLVTQDITSNGAMSIMTYDGNIKYVSYATVEPSTGNIAGGNINAIGTVTGGNIVTAGSVSATGNVRSGNIITPGAVFAEGNVYTESWLVANSFGIDTYQINVTTNANVTGNVTTGNLNIGTVGGLVDTGGNTLSLTTNAGNSATSINLNGNAGIMILSADSNVAFGIGANTYIDISDNGILMDANVTTSGGYNFTGWNNISSNTLSTSGNVSVANVNLGTGGLLQSDNVTILTGNTTAPNGAFNLYDDGIIIVDADTFIINVSGVEPTLTMDGNGLQLTSSLSVAGNITGANLIISQGGVYKDGNTFIFTANVNNDINGVHLVDGGTTVVYAGGNSVIQANSSGTNSNWVFDTTGNLTVPGSSGGLIKTVANGAIGIAAMNNGTDNPAQLLSWRTTQANPDTIVSTYANSATVMTNVTGTINTWSFDNTGNLTLPANTFAVNYANGTAVTLGGAGNYSDSNVVTLLASFGSNTISTTGNVNTGNITTGTGTGGNISGVNIMSANVFIGDGGNLTNLPSSGLVVNSMTSGANITASVNDTQYNVTALAVSANVTAPTGVAQDGQKLTYRIIDNGSAQALTWDAIYQEIGTTLPTTTVASKYVYVGVIYNAQDVTWDVVSVAQQA